jgi:defect-in-organelle-trafficking protein DotB
MDALNGTWRPVTKKAISTDELLAALERLTRNNSVAALIKSGQSDYDFAHEIEESRGVRLRYRGNATPVADGYFHGRQDCLSGNSSMPPALEDLLVEAEILEHAMPSHGLVLVTGVMGSGKSTLLAAILAASLKTAGATSVPMKLPLSSILTPFPIPAGRYRKAPSREHLKSFSDCDAQRTRTAPGCGAVRGKSRPRYAPGHD